MNTPILFYNTSSVDSDEQYVHNLQDLEKYAMIPYMKDRPAYT